MPLYFNFDWTAKPTPPQHDATATFLDNRKDKKNRDVIDKKDKVEITLGGNKFSVPVENFLTSSAFDQFGSPQTRLEILKSGGADCSRQISFSNPFQLRPMQCEKEDKSYRSDKWANQAIEKAQEEYELKERQRFAEQSIPVRSKFTDALRDSLVQDPTLRPDHLMTKLSEITGGPYDSADFVLDSARAFLKNNPDWTWADLAELNRAMGNTLVANQLETKARGDSVWTHLVARAEVATIYLPTGKAKDVLKPKKQIPRIP